ncbi:hypothetical protein CTI12_AA031840 [Artemisia annua]|uniref:histidine--tRNA ligase n=1 Tax=Artemisia annua TaxID=35608 RepID=A0A2U1QGU5_ARTAN|nr:hypothetical protein CTI12_AA031840 [Artemisia annua]
MAGERRVLTLGGKGSSLSEASVFEFATASTPQILKIDPSALTRLYSGHKLKSPSSLFKLQLSVPDYLTPEEARASILLLLNKLLLGGSASPSAASQLSDILNNNAQTKLLSRTSTKKYITPEIIITKGERRVLTLGGKGSSLSEASFFEFASTPQILKIDPSALTRLYSGHKLKSPSSLFKLQLSVPDYLTPEEARASILLLLNKLLLGGSASPSAASQLSDILTNDAQTFTLDLAFDRQDDVDLYKNCWPDITGSAVCALLDYVASSLSKVADAVAALSCEALKTDTATAFNSFMDSGDSFSDKDRASVASDFKVLLNGSKMRGNTQCDPFLEIPITHGRLRSLCKSIHSSTRVELNSIPSVSRGVSKDLTVLFSSLAGSLQSLGEGKETSFDQLLQKVEEVVADGAGAKRGKKKDKKKKVLGKGTTVLMQFIKDRLQSVTSNIDASSLPEKLSTGFLSLLDLKDTSFDQLLQKVKEAVNSNESRRLPKIPKGTCDFANEKMALRERLFSTFVNVCKMHGATQLDTPVIELTDLLTEKYGEDSKLIYNLANQGGELCSLRYDLTVPFGRYVAMNGLTSFRRYQIGKVYRRDNPSKGRSREFYQCDFDIAGDESIGADFEVVRILTELLDEINIGEYAIRLNNRKLLDGMLDICGVPSDKVRTVCSSIDKLDKQPFEQIKKELVGSVYKGDTQVGSIAAGGRYVIRFGGKSVAAVGVSLGFERVFTIMEQKQKDDKQAQVLVSILGDDDNLPLAAKLVSMCWDAKLKARFLVNKRLSKHFDLAKESGIPWIVMVGEKEITKGVVKLQNKDAKVEKEVPTSDFVDELVRLINTPQSRVKATNGDTFLGGEDFDNAVLDFLVSEFKRTEGIDLTKDRLALERLSEAAKKAKIELSSTTQTDINLPFITADASGVKHLNITLTRSKFEALVNNLIERTKNLCKNCVKDAGVTVKEVD